MMKKEFVAALVAACFASNGLSVDARAGSQVPTDVKSTCPATDLASWFASGTIGSGGTVTPADSITFPADNTPCDFYKWASRMFLWLTSPTADGAIMFGDQFFDVVPTASGKFSVIPNGSGVAKTFALRDRKDDFNSTGQAGGSGVLVSQANSLTYYGLAINDVYEAYWANHASFTGDLVNNFPTTQAELDTIQTAAGTTFKDGIALAMELKTSWVDAASVNKSKYLTITATVPNYSQSSTTTWTLNGTETVELALVGIHVVGTVAGHPEMVWATFEHVDNAPDKGFTYTNTSGTTTTTSFPASGSWVFASSGVKDSNHVDELAHVSSGNIVATGSAPIGPSDVVRIVPWGSLAASNIPAGMGQSAIDDIVSNTTDVLSLNASINDALSAVGDVRANYVLVGGIWSQKGQIPTSGTNDFLRGTLAAANATMETFHQFPDANNGFVSQNCFTCHSGTTGQGITTSHIFSGLQPLVLGTRKAN